MFIGFFIVGFGSTDLTSILKTRHLVGYFVGFYRGFTDT